MKRVFVVGASNMDICAKSSDPTREADSNIGVVSTACGGVGRNIAVALRRFGFDVSFLTAIADDTFGHDIMTSLKADAVGSVAPFFTGDGLRKELRSGVYSYVLDSNGALLCGINDMGINDELTPAFVGGYDNALKAADYVVFEANIPVETIEYLGILAKGGVKLAADCVSVSKCDKLSGVLGDLYLLKANYSEACALAGMDDASEEGREKDPLSVAQRLAGKGLERGIITLGKDGAFCFEVQALEGGGLEWYRVAPPSRRIVNANGCGDVLLAGFLAALSKERSLKDALEFGQYAASVNAMSNEAVAKELLGLEPTTDIKSLA